jgi:glycerol-3-phosphate dehydrogenase
MARTIEDVLARRLRLLFLDAKAAISAAPRVAALMAEVLDLDEHWQQQQLEQFGRLAAGYRIAGEKEKPFINNPEMYSMN